MILSAIVIVTNLAFTAAFDTDRRCPVWVDYTLEPGNIVKEERAIISFYADPSVPGTDNAADYAGSAFDRGHMAPAADFNWDTNALRETYSFVNVCPMARGMNRGLWRVIEDTVRRKAEKSPVRVITFPIFLTSTNRIGRVAVPDGFAKVLVMFDRAFVWVVPNK